MNKVNPRYVINLIILLIPIHAFSQIFSFNPGIARSSLDFGPTELLMETYKGKVVHPSVFISCEYANQGKYSLSTEVLLYKSGGRETNVLINEQSLSNPLTEPLMIRNSFISIGENLNFYPVNKKLKVELQFGPRLDIRLKTVSGTFAIEKFSKDGFRRLNAGVSASGGIYYDNRNFRVGMRASYLQRAWDIGELQNVKIYSGRVFRIVQVQENVGMINLCLGYKLKS